MDRDLALAVFERWQAGLPVYEGSLYKAAAYLGLDPDAALLEARFYTVLDNALFEKQAHGTPFQPWQHCMFSAAAGIDPGVMVKTAAAYQLDTDELVMRALMERNWAPDLEKLALMPMQAGAGEGPEMDPSSAGGAPGGAPQGAQANPMLAAPQQGAQVQQQPGLRPGQLSSPTAEGQMPPTPEGNLDALLAQAGQAQAAASGGGLPPAGAGTQPPPPPPPSPEQKIQQMAPDLPPENVQRYSKLMEQVEQQTGIAVTDPKQIQKIIQQGQKQDGKVIDQAIKQISDQQAMQQATMAARPGNAPGGGQPQPPPQQPEPGNEPAGAEKIASAVEAGRILAHRKLALFFDTE